jgi:diguanylate cyclase (GGDEF)-like protein
VAAVRAWARGASAAAFASPVLLLAVYLARPGVALPVASAVHALSVLTAGAGMVLAARSGDPLLRRARLWFAAALAASAASFTVSGLYAAVLGYVPVPSLADATAVAWVPCALAGMLSLPSQEHRGGGRLRALLDSLVTACALSLLFWLLFLEPIYSRSERTGLAKSVLLAFPVIDMVLAITALAVAAHVRADVRRFLRLATVGLILVAVQDAGAAVNLATGSTGFSWTNLVLQTGLATLVAAAFLPTSAQAGDRSSRFGAAVDVALPHLPVVAVVLVVPAKVTAGSVIGGPTLLLACLLVLGLVARQLLYASHLTAIARRLSVDATHDSLTGLVNRRSFLAALDGALAELAPGRVGVVLLDLDGFKEVNDSFGHAAGDAALTDFARRLGEVAGTSALAARLGGDEFALMLTGDDVALRALHISDRMTSSTGATVGALTIVVGASAGVAISREGDTTSQILRRGDLAMYEAKRLGHSRAAVFTDDMAARAERRHLLAQALPGAAERGELSLVYQPLIRLDDGSVAGAEALLRWTHPLHGQVSPLEFIPLAEETGAIEQIGLWVLVQSTQQVRDWAQAGRWLPQLSVNVSPRQLTPEFTATALATVRASALPPSRVTLEVTESALPGLRANRCLQALREEGFSVAMDDFGAGFSSLAQLAVLPVDTLKFDREFIRGVHTPNGRRIVEAVVALAGELGLTTVAEGVEQAAEADVLRRAGCVLAQGYHFAKPVPPLELWAMLPELLPEPLPEPRQEPRPDVLPPVVPEMRRPLAIGESSA